MSLIAEHKSAFHGDSWNLNERRRQSRHLDNYFHPSQIMGNNSFRRKKADVHPKWTINSKKIFVNKPAATIEGQFFELAKIWKKETAMFSVAVRKITHPNYMTIIGMGITYKEPIIKLILRDLQKGEEFWHYALKSITNENPVPKGMVNNLSIVREEWLKWGKDKQMI